MRELGDVHSHSNNADGIFSLFHVPRSWPAFFYLHITCVPCMPYKGQKKYKNILSCCAMAQLTVPGP